jgi:hypothetical protein
LLRPLKVNLVFNTLLVFASLLDFFFPFCLTQVR